MINVKSYSDFKSKMSNSGKSFLLLYKSGSEQGSCVLNNIGELADKSNIYAADITAVSDIHSKFGINSVPALLLFNKGQYQTVVKGCQEVSFYQGLVENSLFDAKPVSKGAKKVTVYSTPTCPWCTTLKGWLEHNNVQYTDIDVSRDQQAAYDLVRRSGQQGVPQTDINGQIVVGFDQNRLKQLLELA